MEPLSIALASTAALKNITSLSHVEQFRKQKGSFKTLLGISLLQECTPEFIALSRMDEHQLPVFDRQSVIYHDVDPLTELPKLQDKAIIKTSKKPYHLAERYERGGDGLRKPESERFQRSHPERTARVAPRGEEAAHSG